MLCMIDYSQVQVCLAFQLYFKITDFTHSGCMIDAKSIQVSPALKYKLTTGKTVTCSLDKRANSCVAFCQFHLTNCIYQSRIWTVISKWPWPDCRDFYNIEANLDLNVGIYYLDIFPFVTVWQQHILDWNSWKKMCASFFVITWMEIDFEIISHFLLLLTINEQN